MSRGRGGGRGGRGGGRGGGLRIGGIEIPWDPDLGQLDKPKPTPLFPPEFKPLPPTPLTKDERAHIARFRALRDRIHEGPLYTVLGDNARVGKSRIPAAAQFDPFEGMPTYSQKYTKRRRKLPKLDTRPYVLKFFPTELWSTLDPQSTSTHPAASTPREKKLHLSSLSKKTTLNSYDRSPSPGADKSTERSRNLADQLNGAEEDEEMAEPVDEEDIPPEEEVDDDYDDDEDDMAGDYNAEQYFEDGGDDGGEDYEGGEADGGEY